MIALVLVAAACSGDDASDAATTGVPTTTSAAPSTTAAPETTTTTSTTESPVPTTSSTAVTDTSSPTSVPAPDSTLDPNDPVAQAEAVLAAVEAAMRASVNAVRSPSDDRVVAQLSDHYTGVLLEGWRNVVADYRANNLRQLENTVEPDAFVAELASLAVSASGTLATVQGCEITSGIVVEIGGNPDGTDRVIEDGIGRTVLELEVVVEDGAWKVRDAIEPDPSDRIASCE